MEYSMDNIADLLGSLSDADLDALKHTAENLFGGGGGAKKPPPKPDLGSISPEMIGKIGRIVQAMQGAQDERSELIAALKPYLSAPRQKRADEAMQILRMLDILPLLQSGLF
ncbi:MAG: hypothetical protein ACI4I5_02455 [Acutalibacteraceae bacterium]